MPSHDDLVTVPCRVSKGIFSTELMVCVELPGNNEYVGLVPRLYCWNKDFQKFMSDQPQSDKVEEGYVGAQILRRQNGEVLVQFPDGDVAVVQTSQTQPYPESAQNVPVGS